MMLFTLTTLVVALPFISARTIVIANRCPFTVWPAYFTNPDSKSQISGPTGWESPPNSKKTMTVPDGWGGRFWARQNCDFSSGSALPSACTIGGCNGGLQCDRATGTGVPPVTLAEFTLNGSADQDFYDISNVDGSSITIQIQNNKNCPSPKCVNDINASCPEALKVMDGGGKVVGCKSSCSAGLDPNRDQSPSCCTGSFNTAETCPSSGVQHYDHFKQKCPNAYAFAYDEVSESALWTCSSADGPAYTVTFCP